MSELKGMGKDVGAARDKALEALFSSMPKDEDIEVDLPSRGKFYKDVSKSNSISAFFL